MQDGMVEYWSLNRPHGLEVRTQPFQGYNSGSSPDGGTKSQEDFSPAIFFSAASPRVNQITWVDNSTRSLERKLPSTTLWFLLPAKSVENNP